MLFYSKNYYNLYNQERVRTSNRFPSKQTKSKYKYKYSDWGRAIALLHQFNHLCVDTGYVSFFLNIDSLN